MMRSKAVAVERHYPNWICVWPRISSHVDRSDTHGLTLRGCLEEMAWQVLHLLSFLAAWFDKIFERGEN